ncbi:lipocalin-like domain-containing protein [Microcoleus vaginatus]|uniref:lipocalin-like domain-containing protein n=1 Tax=Microcoleus vaginatus TaxID=119532 RepID=UPI0040408E03
MFPNWVVTDQERFFEFKDDRLTFSTPLIPIGGEEQIAYLIWKRAPASAPEG